MKNMEELYQFLSSEEDFVGTKLKYIGRNLRILNAFGMWPSQKPGSSSRRWYKCYTVLIVAINAVFILPGVMYLVSVSDSSIQEILENINMNLLDFNLIVKMLPFLTARTSVAAPLLTLKLIEESVSLSKIQEEIMARGEKRMRRITDSYFLSIFVTCSVWILSTIPATADSARELPFRGWYPFDVSVSPNYELVYFLQAISAVTACLIVWATNTFYFSLIIIAATHFEAVSCAVRNVRATAVERAGTSVTTYNSLVAKEMEACMSAVISYHQKVLRFGDEVRQFLGHILFTEFFIICILLCCLIFQAMVSDVTSPQFLVSLTLLACQLPQAFIYCYYGTDLIWKSLSVQQAAYDSGWHSSSSIQFRKSIQMMIMRAQKPTKLTALSFADVSLQFFTKVLRTSYSFYTLLHQIHIGKSDVEI